MPWALFIPMLVAGTYGQYFSQHLEILKSSYCMSMRLVIDDFGGVYHFCKLGFGCATRIFKLIMKFNVFQVMVNVGVLTIDKAHPLIINPFTHLWCIINACQLLFYIFPKYLNLAEIALIHIF
jgi:hypothetical protein